MSQNISLPNKKDVYKGLVNGDFCRFNELPECKKVAKELNVIIQDQSDFIVDLTVEYKKMQVSKDSMFVEKEKAVINWGKAKNKKTPFYKNPWYYLIAGFIGGIFASK